MGWGEVTKIDTKRGIFLFFILGPYSLHFNFMSDEKITTNSYKCPFVSTATNVFCQGDSFWREMRKELVELSSSIDFAVSISQVSGVH
jgi:hypothetical protein